MKLPGQFILSWNPWLFIAGWFVFLLLSLNASSNPLVMERYPHILNSNSLPIAFEVEGEAPEWMAVVIQKGDPMAEARAEWDRALASWRAEIKTNRNAKMPPHPSSNRTAYDAAEWIRFQTNYLADLAPGDGKRSIMFGYKYRGQTRCDSWTGSSVTVQTALPVISIVSPTSFVTSQPVIQLQGTSSQELKSVRYDCYNEKGEKVVGDAQGYAGGTYGGDTKFQSRHGRDYFTCFDMDLTPGTNTLVLHLSDDAGNSMTTNLVVIFTTVGDTIPPTLNVQWPRSGHRLMGGTFTIRGRTDDPTAKMHGINVANEQTNNFEGFAERNGFVWFENVPLAIGTNALTLTATDAAGNRTSTNLVVYGTGSTVLTVEPIEPKKLWDPFISVKGMVSPANNHVWINGVQARVNPDGSWTAEKVPVKSPSGGTAIFDMTAIPISSPKGEVSKPNDLVQAQASLGTNPMVLNATSPACGVFQLHLSETGGRGFVLLASTNLTEWTPILTNANPEATFDYTDREGTTHSCRFFKIIPLP